MSFRQVRPSKFRNVFGTGWKREQCYDNIRVSKYSWDSTFCTVNPKFIAIITECGGGGVFIVLPLTKNKAGRVSADHPVVAGHKGPVLDIAWCPHNDNVIASGSEDCVVKIWEIPDQGLTETMTESVVDLVFHQRKVGLVLWHPSAQDVLLTAGSDNMVVIWNAGTAEPNVVIDVHPDLVYSACWNWDGSQFMTTCRDKRIRIINPRTGVVMEESICHEGSKPTRAIFLRNGLIFTTGFSKVNERQYSLRAPQHLNDPIVMVELDTSNGVMFPFYDADTSMVYLCGKGDSVIRYFEISPDPPFVHYINKFQSPDAQRGIGTMPKRGCDVTACEIMRFYRLNNSGLCQIVSMTVPRKMDDNFQAEIVKPEEFLLRWEQQQLQQQHQPRRKSFHDTRCDNPPSGPGDYLSAGRCFSMLPADAAPLTTIQLTSSTPHRFRSHSLNKTDRCPTTSNSHSPDLFLHRKSSLPPFPLELHSDLQAHHLKARRSLTTDLTSAPPKQQMPAQANVVPVFRTLNPPKNRQPLNSLTSGRPEMEQVHAIPRKRTLSTRRLSLDSSSMSSPSSTGSDRNLDLELENWPALETSYAQLMDCDLIECCISVHEDLSRDTSDIQEQVLNFSRSTNGSLIFPTNKEPVVTINPVESASDGSEASATPELPRPLRILRHWMRSMEERLPEMVHQSLEHEANRKAELEVLRKEIERRSSYFLNIERHCTAELQHVGRDLEVRYHRLLLRIMEWSFHLRDPPESEFSRRRPSRGDDSQVAAGLPSDESSPAEEMPSELQSLQVWLQVMEQRVPELNVKAKWEHRKLKNRMLEFQTLQQEIEQRAVHFAELVHQCPPRQQHQARDLELRYHQLLLRIFEWNFHMESLSVHSDSASHDEDETVDPWTAHEDFPLVMEDSHPEAEPKWDGSESTEILPSPGPSSPTDDHVPLAMNLQSCGPRDLDTDSAGVSDEMYMEYISNRRENLSDDDDGTSCKSCCTSFEPEHFETIDLSTGEPDVIPAALSVRDSNLPSELFQEDLYPDTPCDVAALTADEWFAGRDETPILMSMKAVSHQPVSRSENRPAVPAKNRSSRLPVPPARPVKPDPSHLQAVLEQYDTERCRQPSGESQSSDISRPDSLDRYSQSHPSPPHSEFRVTHRVEELMDEIHRLHLLIYQHEERFRAMEARLAENDAKGAGNVAERSSAHSKGAQQQQQQPESDHKSGISSKVMTLVFSPLTVLSVMRQELPSPFAFVSPNRLMSLKPFRAISTTRRLLLSPVSSISAISSSLISALSSNPSK